MPSPDFVCDNSHPCKIACFVPRAVDSALKSAPDGDVQVIVVPNGPESNWRAELTNSLSDSRVQVHPIATAHACAARNHGLSLAKGTYTRFLDDDDVLISENACAQLNFIVETGVKSAAVGCGI